MSEYLGKVNEYVCRKCLCVTRTINRDSGTTPFTIECRANTICCGGTAYSQLYNVDQTAPAPGWEWIKPTPEEFNDWLKRHNKEEYRDELAHHVKLGGLLLQKLDADGRERYGFKSRRA